MGFPGGSTGKESYPMRETWAWSLWIGKIIPWRRGNATPSSILPGEFQQRSSPRTYVSRFINVAITVISIKVFTVC